jgi:arsenate reductase-like glutaredoxin family protein
MFENNLNEITLIFNSDKDDDQKTKTFVDAMENVSITYVDLKSQRLTQDQLSEIIEMLEVDLADLFDPTYADRSKITSLDAALKLLTKNPLLLATPIIIIGDYAYQFESS